MPQNPTTRRKSGDFANDSKSVGRSLSTRNGLSFFGENFHSFFLLVAYLLASYPHIHGVTRDAGHFNLK
jgi:hypothetical protein